MSARSADSALPSITARLSAAEKARFTWLAERAGMSESALARAAIRTVLNPDRKTFHGIDSPPSEHEPATDRITIRLRPGDGQAIAARAAQRGIKPSTYLAALVRAHVATNPPLTTHELAAFKQSVVVLAGLGRLLAQIRSAASAAVTREDLQRLRVAVSDLEQRTHDLAKAALVSWESRGG